MNIKLLSLVVPAYKQEKTIEKDVKNLDKVLSAFAFKHEIIVVVDGFVDKTFEILQNSTPKIKNLRVLGYRENMGKGYAIKFGVQKAKGDIIGFIDAGMEISPSSIPTLLNYMDINGADIVIGSKLHPDSNVRYPLVRKILSWGYRYITHLLFGLKVRDTQAGLKLFKKEAAKEIFSKVKIKDFAFDIEVLVLAKMMDFKVCEAPVKLALKKGTITSLNFFIVAFKMFFDTFRVFWRLRILRDA